MMRGNFETKDPGEKISLPFDFSADLGGAGIASTAVTLALYAGSEGQATTLTQNGSVVVDGAIAYVPVMSGAHFCDYVVRVAATLSDGRVLALAGLLPVRTA